MKKDPNIHKRIYDKFHELFAFLPVAVLSDTSLTEVEKKLDELTAYAKKMNGVE